MGTLSSGWSVFIKSDSHSITPRFNKDTATIHTSGNTIIVRPTSISIDSINVATIDEQVKRVQVDVKNGTATFLTDGKDHLLTPRICLSVDSNQEDSIQPNTSFS